MALHARNFLTRLFRWRLSRVARRLRREIAALERERRRLATDLDIARAEKLIAEAEAKNLSLVVARERQRVQAESAELSRRQANAEQGVAIRK
jgi:hypothetical protein